MNKLVKRVLGTVLSEQRLAGQNPNWTKVLGTVAAVFNSQCGRGENDVSAYEAVYGQKLDHPLSCSKAEARRCWTVNDRMLVTNEPKFDTYCKENYILEDEVNEVTDDDDLDDSGYFSEDDLPVEEMDEVSDEWFMSHLMDDTDTDTPAKHDDCSHKKVVTKKNVDKPLPEDVLGVFPKSYVTKKDERKPPPEDLVPLLPQSRDDRKPPPEDIVPETQDDNGLIFGPSCVGPCFTNTAAEMTRF